MRTPVEFGAAVAELTQAKTAGMFDNYGHYLYDNMVGAPSRALGSAGRAISGAANSAKDMVVSGAKAVPGAAYSAGKDLYDFSTDPLLRTRTMAALGGMDPANVTAADAAPVAKAQNTVARQVGHNYEIAKGFAKPFAPVVGAPVEMLTGYRIPGTEMTEQSHPYVKFVDKLTDPNVGAKGLWRQNVSEPIQKNVVEPFQKNVVDPLKDGLNAFAGHDSSAAGNAAPATTTPATTALQNYGSGLKGWAMANKPLATALALGLGGLGAYGLYDLIRARRRRNRPRYYDYDAREF